MLPKSIQNLINQLSQLPGVGPKTAQRLVFHLLRFSEDRLNTIGQSFINLKSDLSKCKKCFFFSEKNHLCIFCSNFRRNSSLICVVSSPTDVLAIEKSGIYKGLYHVLDGVISPMNGIGPDDLKIKELISRIKSDKKTIKEVILATNPDVEGESTAIYLSKILKPSKVKITRIARGLPIGSEIEYADDSTLSKSLEGRREY